MAGRGRCLRRRSCIQQRRRGSKLGGRGEGADDMIVKPNNCSCGKWICVRGHRIRLRGRMRMDSDGDVYVPDSEDEEFGLDLKTTMAVGGVPADAIAIGADTVSTDGVHVAAGGAVGFAAGGAVNVAAEERAADDVRIEGDMDTGEEMHPEVVARLKKVLGHMDPTFIDLFVSMYKVMVPTFFKP